MSGDRSDDGFTLVELLVASVIAAIIIGGIASILIVTLESYPRSAAKLSLSDNAQLLSSWLVPDVQSAEWDAAGMQTGTLPNVVGCAVDPSSNVVTLTWSDYDLPGVLFVASYRQVGSELRRYFCKGGGPPTITVVGRDLAAPPNGAAATQTVDSVTIAVQTTDLVNGSGTGYNFAVSASRRTPALRIFPVPPLDAAFISGSASAKTIAGTALPNATVNFSVVDQRGDTTSVPPLTADGNGNWSVGVKAIDWDQISLVGLVTFNVTSTNAGLTSTATTSTLTPLTPLVSALSPSPTNSRPVLFLVTFNEAIVQIDSTNLHAVGPNGETLLAKPRKLPNCPAGTAPNSECYEVQVVGLVNDDTDDGPVRLNVPANQVHDAAGNFNVASSPDTITYDSNLPVVTPDPPNPTSTDVSFLVRFPYHLVAPPNPDGRDVSVFSSASEPSMTKAVNPANCPAPVGTSQCFTIIVGGLDNGPGAGAQVTAQVKPGVVTDTQYGGLNSQSVMSAPITWSTTLTIAETPGPVPMTTFGGVAAAVSVTFTLCPDQTCAGQLPLTVSVVAGSWSTQVLTTALAGYQYAEVTQGGQNVFTKIVGP